jgi:hypothetical protein
MPGGADVDFGTEGLGDAAAEFEFVVHLRAMLARKNHWPPLELSAPFHKYADIYRYKNPLKKA